MPGFFDKAEGRGTFVEPTPAEAHWQMGQVENNARYLRQMGYRIVEDIDVSQSDFQTMLDELTDAKNSPATSVKLRLEWEKRLADSACAVAALQARTSLWHRVHGPHAIGLLQTTLLRLQDAQQAATVLRQFIDFRSEDVDLASFGGEILKAVEQLKLVAWDATLQE